MEMGDYMDLKQLVDRHGMQHVLDSLGAIALGTADHISVSYNDKQLSRAWAKAGNAIFRFTNRSKVVAAICH